MAELKKRALSWGIARKMIQRDEQVVLDEEELLNLISWSTFRYSFGLIFLVTRAVAG
jgi:hypothetical protein